MGWNPKYALLILSCTLITYLAAIFIERIKSKEKTLKIRLILFSSIFLILCGLFYFKYLNFSAEILNKISSIFKLDFNIRKFDIILPVGISFFSFQAIGYLVDVYRGEIYAEKNFFKYALFVSFFPQLVAGPIERSKNLLKQLGTTYRFDFLNLKNGLFTMVWGYFLKLVVADRASILVNKVYSTPEATGIQILFATFFFTFQIYADFCGYSTIACGAAKVLGINLVQNFSSPYFSSSFQDFWRRWHISLSSWFRDYIYIPLGGSRKGKLRKNLNVMIVMLVSGIWHGAGLQYVTWGLLNGIFQVFDDFSKDARSKISKWIQIPVTFCFVCGTWLFFRANSLTHAFSLLKKIVFELKPMSLMRHNAEKYNMETTEIGLLLMAIVLIMLVDFARYKNFSIKNWILSRNWIIQAISLISIVIFILTFGIWGTGYNAASFIYFQF